MGCRRYIYFWGRDFGFRGGHFWCWVAIEEMGRLNQVKIKKEKP